MKRRTALSIALALSVIVLALMSSDSKVIAQGGGADFTRFRADTGVVTLGPNQKLRITVANGLRSATVRFRRLEYTPGSCSGGVCKHIISSQLVSDPLTLAPGEAATYNEGDTATNVRCVVTTNRQDVNVKGLIINASTGEVLSFFDVFVGDELR